MFKVSPNPATEELKITWDLNTIAQGQVEIINMVGIVIDRLILDGNKGEMIYQLGKFSPGIYAVRLITRSTSISKRIIILK
jgi:hypothetical protein